VRCLLGERRPDVGRAVLLGEDSWRARARALLEVGVVPEEPDAPPQATPAELGAFCAKLYPRWDGDGFRERLERLAIPERTPFARLSKGERGQVTLGLALASRPRLLLLDDPTLGLDPLARRDLFRELISELADHGTTVFVATHDHAAIEAIATHVAILERGRLLAAEPIEQLKARFRRIRQAPPAVERRPRLVAVGGESAFRAPATSPPLDPLSPLSVAARPWGTETVVSAFDEDTFAPLAAAGAEATPLTLEEIFVALVGGRRP
jgi:ABC-2 type transport system ATP-binding protein